MAGKHAAQCWSMFYTHPGQCFTIWCEQDQGSHDSSRPGATRRLGQLGAAKPTFSFDLVSRDEHSVEVFVRALRTLLHQQVPCPSWGQFLWNRARLRIATSANHHLRNLQQELISGCVDTVYSFCLH